MLCLGGFQLYSRSVPLSSLIQSGEWEKALSYVYTMRISFAPAPGKLSWTGFLFTYKNGDWARFLPVSERSCAVLISKVETHTSGKCSVILYRIAFRIGTKRYLVSSERSLSYHPLILLASRLFFLFKFRRIGSTRVVITYYFWQFSAFLNVSRKPLMG